MNNTDKLKDLVVDYYRKRGQIRKRLKSFKALGKSEDKDIFEELCFCILTPQSKASSCDKAVKELIKRGILYDGRKKQIRDRLKGVRFPNNKTQHLLCARKLFKIEKNIEIKSRVNLKDPQKAREWLVKNVKGLGYKEASHFLRNIGYGDNLAILDTHILKNLKRFSVIKKIPSSMTKKRYLEIEDRMRRFSDIIKIPMSELDLLFWSKETGMIFK